MLCAFARLDESKNVELSTVESLARAQTASSRKAEVQAKTGRFGGDVARRVARRVLTLEPRCITPNLLKFLNIKKKGKVARSRSLLGESAPIQLETARPAPRDGFCGLMPTLGERIALGFGWLSTSFTALINSADHRASAPLHSCIDYPDSTAQLTAAGA